MSLAIFLSRTASRAPAKTAIICGNDRVNYQQLFHLATCAAAAFRAQGIGEGARVAILARNSISYVAALFGLMSCGCVAVPLNTRLTGAEIALLLTHCKPAALVYDRASEGKLSDIPTELPPTLCLDIISHYNTTNADAPVVQPSWHDPAIILYTAGTTGSPKGVVLTHANLLWNTLNYTAAYCMGPADRELAPTPLFHVSTLGRVFTYVFNAVTFILMPTFDAQTCLELIQKEKITSITQVPTMYQMLYETARRGCYDLSSVTRAVTGAAPMTEQGRRQLVELFPNAACYNLYGLTEASPGVTITHAGDFLKKPTSVGRPLLSVNVKVVDEHDLPVPEGRMGEIVCCGPNVMRGYYADTEATAATLRRGWLHTGDEGFYDAEGCLYIVARKKEIIISGGVNIYPGEVEQVLSAHPAVFDAAVVGIPDKRWGEKVVAAVVLRHAATASAEDILQFCRKRLASFKCPKELFFLDSLPRNAAQKLLKQDLVQQLQRLQCSSPYGFQEKKTT